MLFNEYYSNLNLNIGNSSNSSSSGNVSSSLLRSDGEILAGFDTSISTENQGASGEIGKGP